MDNIKYSHYNKYRCIIEQRSNCIYMDIIVIHLSILGSIKIIQKLKGQTKQDAQVDLKVYTRMWHVKCDQ